jgi:DNA-binding GntR family transcriptional regulator
MGIGNPGKDYSLVDIRDLAVAPLYMKSLKWNSTDLAVYSGISQSTLARCWRSLFPATHVLGQLHRRLILVGVYLSRDENTLVFLQSPDSKPNAINESFMRSSRRCALQTLLAADLIRSEITSAAIQSFKKNITERFPHQELFVISTKSVPEFVDLEINSPNDWQAMLHDLVAFTSDTPEVVLHDMQMQLLQWVQNHKNSFVWFAQIDSTNDLHIKRTKAQSLSDALAQEALAEIMKQIRSGKLQAGSRVTESNLAKAMHTSRSQAREAIRTLSASGLLALEQNRSASIPEPTYEDVVDIYAARQALGAVVIKRTCALSAMQLKIASDALENMLTISKSNKSYETGEADLEFQNRLAEATGMLNIPEMIHDLAEQLRMFIAVMRLTYSYPVHDMCRDNQELMRHILAGNINAALVSWNKKMDDALEYLTHQLDEWKLFR